ncbi:MAG: glycosyltransferase [Acidobacteria bacterium]|nr:glycosyltransferase [Acidobacteriota bacterium]
MKGTKLQHTVGLVIAGVVLAAAALLWIIVDSTSPPSDEPPIQRMAVGIWNIVYENQVPDIIVLSAAVLLAGFFASGIGLADRRIATLARRSSNTTAKPLGPAVVMAETRGIYAGPLTVTVLIPAHNEASHITATIASLKIQSRPPERILVVADNCTDNTVELAQKAGVDVLESVDNTKKKAGALNQALKGLLPTLKDNDVVMVMDADTNLDDGFLDSAARRLTEDRALMAIGGLFYGEEGYGILGQFQRNEYIRYAREMRRRRGRVFVLTGTASLFRSRALRTIAASRGTRLPGTPGEVFDTAALTEDNEITIALKSLGALMISPHECTVVTELMPSWKTLWAQRLRWQRGALENIGAYGITPPTLRYWAQQLGIGYGVIALSAYFALMVITMLAMDNWIWFPFWLGLGIIFSVERVVTVWRGGWRARILAMTLFPELLFDMFLNLVYVKGVVDISLGRKADWKHITADGSLDSRAER